MRNSVVNLAPPPGGAVCVGLAESMALMLLWCRTAQVDFSMAPDGGWRWTFDWVMCSG